MVEYKGVVQVPALRAELEQKKCATHPSASGALLTYSQILYLGYGSKPDISLVSLYRTSQSVPNLLQFYINSLTFRRQRASEVTLRDTTPTHGGFRTGPANSPASVGPGGARGGVPLQRVASVPGLPGGSLVRVRWPCVDRRVSACTVPHHSDSPCEC